MKEFWTKRYILYTYLGISILLRLFSFFPSVLDHDESTYLIIGRDILNGKELYTDVTDTKPAGIFLFYAALEFLFGGSIFLKRLVFALVVGLTAHILYKLSQKLFNNNTAAIAPGIIYIFYTSIWTYHGRSPNTELLFNLLTIGALLLFLQPGLKYWTAGGFLIGLGFIVKYLVIFDLAAFLLFFFIYDIHRNLKIVQSLEFWGKYLLAGIAFLLPFGLLNLYFWFDDPVHDFFYVTYQLPGNYGSNPSLGRYGIMILDFLGKFFPISFFVFYVVIKNRIVSSIYKWFFFMWIFAIIIAIYLPGKEFSHYTIQLMLPMSLLAGLFFHSEYKKDRYTSFVTSGLTARILLAAGIIVIQAISFNNEIMKRDYPREVAAMIKEELKPGESIYVSNYEQIVYYLLELDSPTKYVHPNLIFTDTHKAFKINVDNELNKIMASSPHFIIVEKDNKKMGELLANKYKLIWAVKKGSIRLYQQI
jgi:4-amino-4-deoxy-L-arabinose transferase-like glycosyltransferase